MCYARIATFIIAFCLSATIAFSFEIEDQHTYSVKNSAHNLRILSTADRDVFEPIIKAFQTENPTIGIDYVVASSAQVMQAIYTEHAPFDLVISSAMDLQTKLANDGFAQTYFSDATRNLPAWVTWRNQIFAFTQEPAVLVLSEKIFDGLAIPRTREELIELIRVNPKIFDGKIGTYDVRTSGLGYLFATQDSRNTETFWRLTEVMGRLNVKLYCCSSDMISAVASGELAFAYNVLGSYAASRLTDTPGISIVPMSDFVSVMLRTALIPETSKNLAVSGLMIDFLAGLTKRPSLMAQTGLPAIDSDALKNGKALRPIRLGPGLLVFLDSMRRESFLRSWASSIHQK